MIDECCGSSVGQGDGEEEGAARQVVTPIPHHWFAPNAWIGWRVLGSRASGRAAMVGCGGAGRPGTVATPVQGGGVDGVVRIPS
jgi:hypothetical protein